MDAEAGFIPAWSKRRRIGRFWFVVLNSIVFRLFVSVSMNFVFYFLTTLVIEKIVQGEIDIGFLLGLLS